ncbi:MAG: TolB family protein [Actinomycetota bacterium]
MAVSAICVAALLVETGPAKASFPGANGLLVFQRDDGDIYTMNPDGSNILRVIDHAAQDNNPQWSPGGTRILFNSDRAGTQDIWSADVFDAGDDVLVYGTPALEFNPTWCPGPGPPVVAFMSDAAGNFDIYTIDFSPTPTPIRLTDNPLLDGHPSCGPGGKVLYQSVVATGNTDVMVVNTDGSGMTNLTNAPGFQGFPHWFPTGDKFAYANQGDIYVANADGTNPVNITESQATEGEPAVSPDGVLMAFNYMAEEGSNAGLAVTVDSWDGGGTTVIETPENEYSADWQPLVDPVEHDRTVDAKVKRRPRRIEGEVIVPDGFDPCADGVSVDLQKKTKAGWKTVDTTTTAPDGTFQFPATTGWSFAKLPRTRVLKANAAWESWDDQEVCNDYKSARITP